MAKTATISKVGKRINAALNRKGVHPNDVTKALGGRAIQTWYRWVNGYQEGGWKDLAATGLFLGMTPNDLMLESDEVLDPAFNEEDAVQIESLNALLKEWTQLVGKEPAERPVAVIHQHVAALLGSVKDFGRSKSS